MFGEDSATNYDHFRTHGVKPGEQSFQFIQLLARINLDEAQYDKRLLIQCDGACINQRLNLGLKLDWL